MTAWGQAKYDAAKPGLSGPKAQPLGNDPMMSCEPMGFPRIMLYQAVPTDDGVDTGPHTRLSTTQSPHLADHSDRWPRTAQNAGSPDGSDIRSGKWDGTTSSSWTRMAPG